MERISVESASIELGLPRAESESPEINVPEFDNPGFVPPELRPDSPPPSPDSKKFGQILVLTGSNILQVTYDDNSNSNSWSFHSGGSSVHITELFRLKPAGGEKVRIVGLPPPSSSLSVKWQLTVTEDDLGAPDNTPKFMPDNGAGNSLAHTEFKIETQTGTGLVAFSFVTFNNPKRHYLVPSPDNGVYHIVTKQTTEKQFLFTFQDDTSFRRRIISGANDDAFTAASLELSVDISHNTSVANTL